MNNIQSFDNEEFGEIRTVNLGGEIWFVAIDVCRALEIINTTDALQRLDEDERVRFKLGRQGETNIINEPGLYSLILGSRKPNARAFKRWITHEVLPVIRKTGMYCADLQPDTIEALTIALQHEQEANRMLRKRLERHMGSEQRLLASREWSDPAASARAAVYYLERLKELLEKGAVSTRPVSGLGLKPGSGEFIGYSDDEYLYLLPETADMLIRRSFCSEGHSFTMGRKMVYRILKRMDMIVPDPVSGTSTRVKWIDGQTKRLLWVLNSVLKDVGPETYEEWMGVGYDDN